jgi:hypothetical protein
MELTREELLMKLGAARSKARAARRLIDVEVAEKDATFTFALNRDKVRVASAMFTDAAKREGWPDDWSQIEEDLRSEYREEASIAISTYQRAIASIRPS